MSGLLQETRGTVRLLRFDNPARRNALSPALRMELLRPGGGATHRSAACC